MHPSVTKKWLTYREAAEYLGLKMPTLYGLVSAGQIPVLGTKHFRRFDKALLDLWVRDRSLALRKWREDQRKLKSA